MNTDAVLRVDAAAYQFVNHLTERTPWAHKPMAAFAIGGGGLFALLAVPAWHRARMQSDPPRAVAATLWGAASTLLAVSVNRAVIPAVGRPRPFREMPGSKTLVTDVRDFSFPSNHAMAAGAATAGLWVAAHYGDTHMRSIAITSSVLAVFLGFSRVYVGVHYVGDVLGGMVVGATATGLGWYVLEQPLTDLARRAAQHPTLGHFVALNQDASPPHAAVHRDDITLVDVTGTEATSSPTLDVKPTHA